ncbi:MAG: hypothetical protein ACLFM0_05510 [Spirochaetales bacterium]
MGQQKYSYRRSHALGQLVVALALLAVFSGCEALFTTNVFENFARDPDNMSEEQLVAYGNEAIASGDQDKMTSAYNSLSEKVDGRDLSDDPETRNTLVELGLGATDIIGVVSDNLDDPTGVSEKTFDAERRKIARQTADIMLEADSEDFSPDRWAYAGAGVGISALGEGESLEDIEDGEDRERVETLLNNSLEGYEREERTDSEIYRQLTELRDAVNSGS